MKNPKHNLAPSVNNEGLFLSLWTEVAGVFHGFSVGADTIQVRIGDKIVELPSSEKVAAYIQEMRGLRGKKVAILRTDIPEKTFLLRLVGGSG